MISISIPGSGTLNLDHMVLDYNGTLAVDGALLPGVKETLQSLCDHIVIHVVTADTFGKAGDGLQGVDCRLTVLQPGRQDQAKLDFVKHLGADRTVAVGNGRNDALMLEAAALGIAVILSEGASTLSLGKADVVCLNVVDALQLLTHPLRLTATLRC